MDLSAAVDPKTYGIKLGEPRVRSFPMDPWTRKPLRKITATWDISEKRSVSLKVIHWPDRKKVSVMVEDAFHPDQGSYITVPTSASHIAQEDAGRYSQKMLREVFNRYIADPVTLQAVQRHADYPTAAPER